MELIFPLLLSFFLPFLWVFYLNKKDPHPEPIPWLFFAFLLGIISGFLSYFTESYFYNFFKDENKFFLFSSFVEEFFKFILIYLLVFPQKVFDEPIDGMIYMIFSAFGFSFLENIFFVLNSEGSLILTLFLRFLGANFLHLLTSSLIGFGYSYFLKTNNFFIFLISFLSAIFFHFVYNIGVITHGLFIVLPLLWSIFFIVLFDLNYLKNGRRK